jgi:hypothetical protein
MKRYISSSDFKHLLFLPCRTLGLGEHGVRTKKKKEVAMLFLVDVVFVNDCIWV